MQDILDFSGGQHYSETDIVKTIIENRVHLRQLNIQNNFLQAENIAKICKGLYVADGIEQLNISINPVLHAIKDVGELIQSKTNFNSLVAHECRLGNSGALTLAQLLKNHPRLEYVNVNSNSIQEAAALDLMRALNTCPHMKYLHIWGNECARDRLLAVHQAMGMHFELHI